MRALFLRFIRDLRHWSRSLVSGHWSIVNGHWSMVISQMWHGHLVRGSVVPSRAGSPCHSLVEVAVEVVFRHPSSVNGSGLWTG